MERKLSSFHLGSRNIFTGHRILGWQHFQCTKRKDDSVVFYLVTVIWHSFKDKLLIFLLFHLGVFSLSLLLEVSLYHVFGWTYFSLFLLDFIEIRWLWETLSHYHCGLCSIPFFFRNWIPLNLLLYLLSLTGYSAFSLCLFRLHSE